LTHLATELDVAASTQNQAFSALLFLYREVLQQRLPWIDDIVRAKRPRKVPVVFTQLEARAVLARMTPFPARFRRSQGDGYNLNKKTRDAPVVQMHSRAFNWLYPNLSSV